MKAIQMVTAGILGMLLLFGIAAAGEYSLTDPVFGDESKLAAPPVVNDWYNLKWTPPVDMSPPAPLPTITNYQPSSDILTKKTVFSTSSTKITNAAFHSLKIANSFSFR